MKRVLFLFAAVVLSTSMYAQDDISATTVVNKETATEMVADQNPELEKHIQEALKSDEGLQKEAINYLKENPETASAVGEIIEANGGSLDSVISAVLGDSELASSAISFVKDNPELLKKAMKLAGM